MKMDSLFCSSFNYFGCYFESALVNRLDRFEDSSIDIRHVHYLGPCLFIILYLSFEIVI